MGQREARPGPGDTTIGPSRQAEESLRRLALTATAYETVKLMSKGTDVAILVELFDRSTRLARLAVAAATIAPLGGCLDIVANPLNHEPTAYEDSMCKHAPAAKSVVNYGCVAGTELSLRD